MYFIKYKKVEIRNTCKYGREMRRLLRPTQSATRETLVRVRLEARQRSIGQTVLNEILIERRNRGKNLIDYL